MANIVAIVGSPVHPSRTYGLVDYAAQLLQAEGFQVDIWFPTTLAWLNQEVPVNFVPANE